MGWLGMKNWLLDCLASLCLLPLVFGSIAPESSDSKKPSDSAGYDFISLLPEDLLVHVMELSPSHAAPFKLRKVSSIFEACIERRRPFHRILADNLGFAGFESLPHRGDLQVFLNLKFPKTQEGRMAALVLVFLMAIRELKNSPILAAVLEITYEEAALLALNLAEFEKFAKLSKFEKLADPIAIFQHFMKEENASGLHDLMLACPGMFFDFSTAERFSQRGLLRQFIETVARYVSENPQNINILFNRPQLLPMKIFILICSDLPIEKVKEILQSDRGIDCKTFMDFFESFSCGFMYSSLTDREQFEARWQEIIVSAIQWFQLRLAFDPFAMFFNFLTEIHLLSYNLEEWQNAYRDANIIINFAIKVLLARGEYEKVLKYLPNQVSERTLKSIALDHEFSRMLVKEKPKWIEGQRSFASFPSEYQNLHLVMAAAGVDTVDGLTVECDTTLHIHMIYKNCSLESIEKMIERRPYQNLSYHFTCFCEQEMDSSRYLEILTLFAKKPREELDCTFWDSNLKAEIVFQLLDRGQADLLEFLLKNPFGTRATFSDATFAKILESEELTAKLFQHKQFFDQFLGLMHGHSPVQIYYASKFSTKTRPEFVKELLSKAWGEYGRLNCFVPLLALSQSLCSADPTNMHYSGPDYLYQVFVNPELSENSLENALMKTIYESLTPLGRATFNSAFLELVPKINFEEFRWRTFVEPEVGAEVIGE